MSATFHDHSINKIHRSFAVLAVAVAVLLSSLIYQGVSNTQAAAQQIVNIVGNQVSSQIHNTLRLADAHIDALSDHYNFAAPALDRKLLDAIRSLNESVEPVDRLAIFDTRGDLLATTETVSGLGKINISDRDYFQACRSGNLPPKVSGPLSSKANGEQVFILPRCIFQQGKLRAVVVEIISIKQLKRNIDEHLAEIGAQNIHIALLNANGLRTLITDPVEAHAIKDTGNLSHLINSGERENSSNTKLLEVSALSVNYHQAVPGYPLIVSTSISTVDSMLRWAILSTLLVFAYIAALVWGLITIKRDKEANLKMQDEYERYQLLYHDSPTAAITFDIETLTFLDCNQVACDLLKAPRERIIGLNPINFSPEIQPSGQSSKDAAGFIVERLMESGRHKGEWMVRDFEGLDFPAEVTFRKSILQNKQIGLCLFSDITMRKNMEDRLRHSNRTMADLRSEAEAANRAKSAFIANMSHELRTPLNAILGNAQVLALRVQDPENKKMLDAMLTAGDSLLHIIGDVLDISKIEAGKYELEPRPFSLKTLLKDTFNLFELPANRKGLELSLQYLEESVPNHLIGDAPRIRQVLLNLLGNALKFTNEGSIRIQVAWVQSPIEGSVRIVIGVKDTGIGIDPLKLETLFKPFSQIDESITRSYGGSGLGLFISKRIANMMHGTLSVKSEFGLYPVQ